MATWSLVYAFVQRHPTSAPISTWTPLDDAVPLWRGAIWIYVAPYLIAPVVAARIARDVLDDMLRRAWAAWAIGIACFLALPTIVQRPTFPAPTSLTERLHDAVAALDAPPGNAAPSLHVALAVLLAGAMAAERPARRGAAAAFAAVVSAATLLLRQHHLIDVVTGAVIGLAALLSPWPRRASAR